MPTSRDTHEVLQNKQAIRADDAESMELFKDLQAGILSPHYHRQAYYWLVQFHDGEDGCLEAKYFLGLLARSHFGRISALSSLENPQTRAAMSPEMQRIADRLRLAASSQVTIDCVNRVRDVAILSEYEYYWAHGAGSPRTDTDNSGGVTQADYEGSVARAIHVNVLLSDAAYKKLGLEQRPGDQAFREGMAARGRSSNLRDPSPEDWEPEYRAKFDALLVVGCNPNRDQQEIDALRTIVKAFTATFHEEVGNRIKVTPKDGPAYTVEQFGFRDGISQPIFYETELQKKRAVQSGWDPFAPLGLALAPDPNGRKPLACGSYFVFRKLAQDIALFHSQTAKLAAARDVDPEVLRAGLVGRQRNGAPLTPTDRANDNDFDYDDDQRGINCPFHAHVRKSNPRQDVRAVYKPQKHRVVRRGISYGSVPRDPATGIPTQPDGDHGPVGLLFLCAQSNIESQFEHIQGTWENNSDHPPGKLAGVDPVSGQEPDRIMIRSAPKSPTPPNDNYRQVVSLKGGEYFFAPSISFLRGLLDDLLT